MWVNKRGSKLIDDVVSYNNDHIRYVDNTVVNDVTMTYDGYVVMVDPPLNSRGLLQQSGVPSRLIDSVIITHCHADHDQGTLQKILEESQVTLMTTPTIMGSFIKKYSALTGLTEDFLRRLFIFRPVVLAEPIRLNGGEIRFFYSIHTIPCIGFEIYYGGKSLYFSGDTCFDPALITKMEKDGALRPGRAQVMSLTSPVFILR